ncbi:MAG: glycosyltransferase family 1 protein [Chloroflexota bacterium]
MTRIGVDYTAAVAQSAGIGRYVRELFTAFHQLEHKHQLSFFAASAKPFRSDLLNVRRLPFHDKWLARAWHRFRLPIPVELLTGRVDLFHSPDFTLPPTLKGTLTLLTVHDLSFVQIPESADDQLREYLNRAVPHSVDRSDHILADSKSTRQDLIDLWGTLPEKVTVLYPGIDSHFQPVTDSDEQKRIRIKYKLDTHPFILSIGTLQPRKNYKMLIRAFRQLSTEFPELVLVIGGGPGWKYQDILLEPEVMGIKDKVRFIGFVADEDLPTLMSTCSIFAMPSLYEGFGLPVLEAMACGVPVITSNISSLPEVAGDAAVTVHPHDQDQLAQALYLMLSDQDRRHDAIRKGFKQASRFSWEQSARQLLSIYNTMLS